MAKILRFRMRNLAEVNEVGDRLEKLKELARILAETIDEAKYAKDIPVLARQYRETLEEIELIEGNDGDEDEIAKLLQGREADGKSGAVR
jgi:hypothetical protein